MKKVAFYDLLSILILLVIAICWMMMAFRNFQPLNRCDWDKIFTYHELQRKTVVEYHQLPLWNPYLCGGLPWLAHPCSDFFNLNFLFILFLGTIKGTVFIYFFQAFIGVLGLFHLSRYYKLNYLLSLLDSVFFLNAFNILTFIGGFALLDISLFPWVYLFLNKSKTQIKYLFFLIIILSYFIYSGSIYIFIMTFMVILIDWIYYIISNRKPKFILTIFTVLSLVFFITSPKVLPMVELLVNTPRQIDLPAFPGLLNINNIQTGLVKLKHFFFSQDRIYQMINFSPPDVARNLQDSLNGYHFSIITIFLLVFSYFLLWRKYKVLVIINTAFLLLALGDNSPINLWRLLHFFLPAFKVSYKFLIIVLTTYSLSIGLTISEICAKFGSSKMLKVILLIVIFVVPYDAFFAASKIFKNMIVIQYKLNNPSGEFLQTPGVGEKMFDSIYNNQGVIYGYDSIGNYISTKVIPFGHISYKGEYFLKDNFGMIKKMTFSPNKLKFSVDIFKDDILIINQNYFPNWHSSAGRVINYNGLLGVPVKKGTKDITVYYLPISFVLGIIFFISSGIVLIYISRKKRNVVFVY